MDLPTWAYVSRPTTPLNINDQTNYKLGNAVMGATVTWDRQQEKALWTDGDVTVSRRRGSVMDSVEVWVLGDLENQRDNLATLISAFTQDTFNFQLVLGTAPDTVTYTWACEAADYSVKFAKEYILGEKLSVAFSFPRFPVPIIGSF